MPTVGHDLSTLKALPRFTPKHSESDLRTLPLPTARYRNQPKQLSCSVLPTPIFDNALVMYTMYIVSATIDDSNASTAFGDPSCRVVENDTN